MSASPGTPGGGPRWIERQATDDRTLTATRAGGLVGRSPRTATRIGRRLDSAIPASSVLRNPTARIRKGGPQSAPTRFARRCATAAVPGDWSRRLPVLHEARIQTGTPAA